MGFIGALLAFQVSMVTWERSPGAFVVSLVLLGLVLIAPRGYRGQRCAPLAGAGAVRVPASELAKFAVLIYAADYMVRKMEVKERFFRAVLPMGAAVAIVGCCCWPSRTWAPFW